MCIVQCAQHHLDASSKWINVVHFESIDSPYIVHFRCKDSPYVQSTPYLYSFIGENARQVPDNCFYGACPPRRDVRIVDEDYYDRTTIADYRKCWQHCKFLRGGILSLLRFEHLNDAFILEPNIGCLVWTYNSTSDCDNCFTYNRFPDCYMVDRSVGWYSGSPC